MKTLKLLGLGVLLSLTLPLASWGDDGDKALPDGNRGDYVSRSFYLCDGATGGATKDCAEFDTFQPGLGLPHFVVVYLNDDDTGCGGTPEALIRGFNEESAAVKHEENDGTTLSTSGDTAVILDPPAWRYYDASISTGSSCTDYEVVITLFYRRGPF